MKIGVLSSDDRRVAIIPETIKKFHKLGHEILVEKGAGEKAFCSDEQYEAAGASLHSRTDILSQSGILVSVAPPDAKELSQLSEGTYVLSLFNPRMNKEIGNEIGGLPMKAFSLDMIPRTTIAQSMDILSSMASLAGYKAVLIAANHLPGYFPMLMTAAGTIPPARVLVLGAGVAGLQAIATAKRLGATVEAFDVRTAAKQEVESLGAKFVEVEGASDDKGAGGYAVQQTEDFQRKQKEVIHKHASKSDVIITTANIPGRKAPLLIEERTVKAMKAGSVIVDLAAITGGNCALTQNDQTVYENGVAIIGNSSLPSEMPLHASKLFSNNVFNFVQYVWSEEQEVPDWENEIVSNTLIKTS